MFPPGLSGDAVVAKLIAELEAYEKAVVAVGDIPCKQYGKSDVCECCDPVLDALEALNADLADLETVE